MKPREPDDHGAGRRQECVTSQGGLSFYHSYGPQNQASPAWTCGVTASSAIRIAWGYQLLYRDQILDQDATAESDGFPVYSLYRNNPAQRRRMRCVTPTGPAGSMVRFYAQYQQDETVTSTTWWRILAEMTLILKWITRRRSAIPAATNRTRMPRKSIRAGSSHDYGRQPSRSCTQMDVYGNRLDIHRQQREY